MAIKHSCKLCVYVQLLVLLSSDSCLNEACFFIVKTLAIQIWSEIFEILKCFFFASFQATPKTVEPRRVKSSLSTNLQRAPFVWMMRMSSLRLETRITDQIPQGTLPAPAPAHKPDLPVSSRKVGQNIPNVLRHCGFPTLSQVTLHT